MVAGVAPGEWVGAHPLGVEVVAAVGDYGRGYLARGDAHASYPGD